MQGEAIGNSDQILLSANAVNTYSTPWTKRKKARKNVASAKGAVCVQHPWREAYAVCSYCNRPFCYADLIKQHKEFYCLEDADLSKHADMALMRGSTGMNFVGALLISNAIIIGLAIYTHILFFLGLLGTSGIASLFANLSAAWLVFYANLLLAVFGLAAGLGMIFSRSDGIRTLSKFILAFTIIIFAYQYAISMSTYALLILAIESFAGLLFAYFTMVIHVHNYDNELFGKAFHTAK